RDVTFGIQPMVDSQGVHIAYLVPGGASERAGLQQNDVIQTLGDVDLTSYRSFEAALAALRARVEGKTELPYVARRGSETVRGTFPIQLKTNVHTQIVPVPDASAKAQRIRHGLFAGAASQSSMR